MSCTNCMTPYSKLRKEHGCSKCGFSFCQKCVSKNFIIPGLSPKPVSVCDSCFNILSGKNSSNQPLNRQKSRDEPGSSAKNWWGDDKLPPPSMRQPFTKVRLGTDNENSGGKGGQRDWDKLEERLEKLKEHANRNRVSVPNDEAAHVAQLEQRLADLRGVPVEVIRKPRLMVCDPKDLDEDDEEELTDDVKKLLSAAESRAKVDRNAHAYDNSALQLDDVPETPSGNSGISSARSSDSSLIVQEAQDAPSVSSQSDLSRQLYPNFEECIRKTMEDAKVAEQEAIQFIRMSEEAESSRSNQTTPCDNGQKSPIQKGLDKNPKSYVNDKPESPKKKNTFLTKFFK
ncbi:FYVE zinc finger domain-containing protein [Ditylenchus destructor]|nr:FYVE zinc finger domain-containing protein [Ditylenchus destructor]